PDLPRFPKKKGAVVTGTVTQSKPITPFRDSTWEVTLPVQDLGSASIEPDMQKDIAPGGYTDASIMSRSTLTVHAVTSVFKNSPLEPQSHLVVDDGSGPVVIYVRGGFTFRG